MLEPLAAKDCAPDRIARCPARSERLRAGSRPRGNSNRAARRRCARRSPRPAKPASPSARKHSTSAARSKPDRVNEESLRGARGRVGRMELRSPVDGSSTISSDHHRRLRPSGQKVMEVVPMGDKLLVETRVKPSDIAFIKWATERWSKSPLMTFRPMGARRPRCAGVGGFDLR